MFIRRSLSFARCVATLWCCVMAGQALAQPPAFDAALRERIDAFVESERSASGIPGIALAIVHEGGAAHVRGFGHHGRGKAISADTPFPIGSLTKSFTAVLVRRRHRAAAARQHRQHRRTGARA